MPEMQIPDIWLFATASAQSEGIPQCVMAVQMSVMYGLYLSGGNLAIGPPLRGSSESEGLFPAAYFYSACLNREAKWSKIFPAIRPGNWGGASVDQIPIFTVRRVNAHPTLCDSSPNQYDRYDIASCFMSECVV